MFVPEADISVIQNMDHGVLFLMAFWSGPAIQAFAELSSILAEPENQPLKFVVADVDGSPSLYDVLQFRTAVSGCGETAWICDGQIVATSGLGLNIECFKPNTSTLLVLSKYGREASPFQIAADFHWLRPWKGIGEIAESLEAELAKEICDRHCLQGTAVHLIGKREDCDDVLVAMEEDNRLAVVHLTWSGHVELDSRFPVTEFYSGWQDWVDRCLLPEHRLYRNKPI